ASCRLNLAVEGWRPCARTPGTSPGKHPPRRVRHAESAGIDAGPSARAAVPAPRRPPRRLRQRTSESTPSQSAGSRTLRQIDGCVEGLVPLVATQSACLAQGDSTVYHSTALERRNGGDFSIELLFTDACSVETLGSGTAAGRQEAAGAIPAQLAGLRRLPRH